MFDIDIVNPNQDIERPKVDRVEVDKNLLLPGESTNLLVYVSDNLSGFATDKSYYTPQPANVEFACGSTYFKVPITYDKEKGAFVGTVELPSYLTTGIYKLCIVNIMDIAMNNKSYSFYPKNDFTSETARLLSGGIIEVVQSMDEKIAPQIKVANLLYDDQKFAGSYTPDVVVDQGTFTVNLGIDENTVPKEIFQGIKGKDKDVTFESNGVEWTFNGKDINTDEFKDINLNVGSIASADVTSDIEGVAEDAKIIHFDYHGELLGKAKVKVYVGRGSDLDGKDLVFYYYNEETKEITKACGPLAIDNDGYVTVEITHCSNYFLSADPDLDGTKVGEGTTGGTTGGTTTKTGDVANYIFVFGLMMLSFSGLVLASKKKFTK